jgi:outer membrane protein assembly factor BamB
VLDGAVIVAASGRLVGYDADTGRPRWLGPARLGSYSSPHVAVFDGVIQVVHLHGSGATSVNPADGKVLWEHTWEGGAIVQPALLPDGMLINSIVATGGQGIRRLAVKRDAEKWTVEERWTSTGLKPYFNDFVVDDGHAYGFDGSILASIDLTDGRRVWKGGRYGSGQLALLPEQDLLLVVSEDGELALVSATPDQFREVARIPAIEGKTWNHPALVRDVLLVRNGEEMAAFRLKTQTQNPELGTKK